MTFIYEMIATRLLRSIGARNLTGLSKAFSTSRVVQFDPRSPLQPPKVVSSYNLPTESDDASPKTYTNPIREIFKESDSYSRTSGAYRLMSRDKPEKKNTAAVDQIITRKQGTDLAGLIGRNWNPGEVYAPHDLHQAELSRYKMRTSPSVDVFDILDINPLEHYRNFSIMSEWMTPMGRIKSRKETGLRPVNQRRIAKAIRRSIGIGMMSSVHRHPEILYKDRLRFESQRSNF